MEIISHFAASFAQDEPVRLEGVEIVTQDGFDSTGVSFVAFGANGVSDDNIPVAEYVLPENGRYSLTVHRAGDLTLESTIMVGTLDVSAVYGKDYRILEGDYIEESCTLVAADNEKSFSDVEPLRWSYDDIRNVTAREIFNGNGDGGRLNPDGTADKEQLAAMTTRFLRLMHKQMK